ncbi:hypothetical protein NQ318_007513 [Aromia moschata]|uniref:Uncharacterized protein n=1 Tax=Aromia moschata TaxID=1265417 RepID=A0AAV8YDI2_9CUCU|nr:hypothetical protein NQ318_007513 [Aromia moschata]
MEDFAIIEAGFNNADETINFGTRSIGYDTLYEISTIACLKCSDDNSGVEQVLLNSLIRNEKVFLTVNKSIKIFKDAELIDLVFNAVFYSVVF